MKTKMLLMFLIMASPVFGQSLSPVTSEMKGPNVKGQVIAWNHTLVPLAVTFEARRLTSVNHVPYFVGLPSGVSVELSQNSARIGIHQNQAIGYKIHCEDLPCAVTVYARFIAKRRTNGLQTAFIVPSTIYVCPKARKCRETILRGLGLWKD